MFCTECGTQLTANAKFCSSCGHSLQKSTTVDAPSTSGPASASAVPERIFLDSGGVRVTEAVFKTSTGDIYPIRNITSVAVRRRTPAVIVTIIAMGLTLFGFFIMLGSVAIGVFVLFVAALFWANVATQPYELRIGSGGVDQVAIESKEEPSLQGIASSINEALLHIQRG